MMLECLYQQVLDDPGSDQARLILADCMERYGHPQRAELIRLQVEAGRIHLGGGTFPVRDGTSEGYRLQKRAYELLSRWCVDWVYPLDFRNISGVASAKDDVGIDVHFSIGKTPGNARKIVLRFRRGFVDEVLATFSVLDRVLGSLLAAHHPIRYARATDKVPTSFSDVTAVWERDMDELTDGWPFLCPLSARLPGAVFEKLKLGMRGGFALALGVDTDRRYLNLTEAQEDLSDAMICCAREHDGAPSDPIDQEDL